MNPTDIPGAVWLRRASYAIIVGIFLASCAQQDAPVEPSPDNLSSNIQPASSQGDASPAAASSDPLSDPLSDSESQSADPISDNKSPAQKITDVTPEKGLLFGRKVSLVKNQGCGCCEAWANHLRSEGADVTVTEQSPASRVASLKIPPSAQSCHTGLINGFIFEGHVPAADIQHFLANPPPKALGLAVPGMPVGSPGMEMGDRHDAYDVLLLLPNGVTSVFTSYPSSGPSPSSFR